MSEQPIRKKTIEEKKQELRAKEKMLKEQERLSSQKRLIEIGKLASIAKIAQLESPVLLGAFLEISDRSGDQVVVENWRKSSQKISQEIKGNRITISFKNPPSLETKNQLKDLNFRWNKFREEYYGFGEMTEISSLFKSLDCKISSIE